jgi:RNA polymerase sigma factor (sigma-70 family)
MLRDVAAVLAPADLRCLRAALGPGAPASLLFRRASLAVRGSIKAYLAVAVRNRARTIHRETQRRSARDTQWADSHADRGVEENTSPTPDRTLIMRAVETALCELPERQEIVVRLRLQGMSLAEVQAATGAVTAKAVERVYARAIKNLRTTLSGNSLGAPALSPGAADCWCNRRVRSIR